jgi:hypothetical protein
MRILILVVLIFIAGCKKEPVSVPETKVDKPTIKETKPKVVEKPLPKPTMGVFAAIDTDNVEEIRRNIYHDKTCLDKKDPIKIHYFPLHYAARNGQLFSLKVLADYTDINKRIKSEVGSVALIYASMHGHFEVVKYLVEKDADVNIIFGKIVNGKKVNSGFTALYAACIDDHHKITEFLLKNGADRNMICATDQQKPETALDIALMNNSKLSKLLLAKHREKKASEILKK